MQRAFRDDSDASGEVKIVIKQRLHVAELHKRISPKAKIFFNKPPIASAQKDFVDQYF